MPTLPNGVLVVHKPTNWSSFDVVGKVRNTLEKHLKGQGHTFTRRRRLKVGHGGTLDPLATGLLVLGVGDGCRKLQSYLRGPKAYAARAQLGIATDTQDSTGLVTVTAPCSHVTLETLRGAAASNVGTVMQRPPIHSALKRDGKRLYELARAGEITPEEVEARPVTVYGLRVSDYDAAAGTFALHVSCSGGTYVRALIDDIGKKVGSAAHMIALERTKHGPFCTEAEAEAMAEGGGARVARAEPVQMDDFADAEVLLGALRLAGEQLAALELAPAPEEA